jgi:uncharacterized protein
MRSARPLADSPPDDAPPAPSAAALRPVDLRDRIGLVDSIRGVAVFGILWVNVFLRSDPLQLGVLSHDRDGLAWLVALTGTLKFRSMFAFLFGLGLAIQVGRAQDDRRFVRTYLRRLSVLLLFGVLHFALLWPGDILVMYTICGMLLLPLRHLEVRRLLWIAGAMFLVAMAQQVAGVHLFDKAALRADLASAYAVYGQGSFWAVTARRVHDYVYFWTPSLWVTFPGVFAMMVLGLVFERGQYLRAPERHLALWRWLCGGGYLVGVPTNALFATWQISAAPSGALTFAAKLAHGLGAPALCLAYVATLVLLSRTALARRAMDALAAVGRMSVTAYLGHSVVCSFLFYGYGLAWFGKVGKWHDVGICFALFLGELAFANAWFAWFRMGPLEWLWRWATYGARPPLRHRPAGGDAPLGALVGVPVERGDP